MPRVERILSLEKKLRGLRRQAEEANVSVIVGYTQTYAVYVHEDLSARHAEGKQAKYLETPLRKLGGELGSIAAQIFKRTGSMRTALLTAGLRLQRESQEIVPIDTSALRASAFTCSEEELESVAAAAFARSEAIRKAGKRKGLRE